MLTLIILGKAKKGMSKNFKNKKPKRNNVVDISEMK